MPPPHDALALGTVIDGRYRIERVLGAGGMGAVYEARNVQRGLGRRVALKVLHRPDAEGLRADESTARFLREARLSAELQHDHIVDVFDVGEHEGWPYLVMECLDGESLQAFIAREAPLLPAVVADLMVPVCAAVHYAHTRGIVHRDLKPANVFLAQSAHGARVPKVLDFGLARSVAGESTEITRAGMLLGTPNFMPLEQITNAAHVDALCDQYALGVTLYYCSTRRLPFAGGITEVIAQKLQGAPPRTEGFAPGSFRDTVLRAMASDARQRFPTVHDLGAALLPFASDGVRRTWSQSFGVSEPSSVESVRVPVPSVPSVPPGPSAPPPPPAHPWSACALKLVHLASGTERRHGLEKLPLSIGRREDNDLVLPYDDVSDRHATISLDGGALVIVRVGSRPLLVNGAAVDRVVFSFGDTARVGSVELRLSRPEARGPRAAFGVPALSAREIATMKSKKGQ